MAKEPLSSVAHLPLTAIFATRSKMAVLRETLASLQPLSLRELVRRTGMAYRSVELAVRELITAGVLLETSEGREKRIAVNSDHRLFTHISAIYHAEIDFFASFRAEMRMLLDQASLPAIQSVSFVGSTALAQEMLGEDIQLLLIAEEEITGNRAKTMISEKNRAFFSRFGLTTSVSAYSTAQARKMWLTRTPAAESLVRTADPIWGVPPLSLLESHES